MTSSLRNSVHRRNHKERSQLAHRQKFGILEKHSDYVKRARDYHSKQDRLTRLKQKAAERNKDEFYFSMTRERTKAGVHIKDRGNAPLPTDLVKLLKTQDENYVRTMRTAGLKKIDKLKNQLTAMISNYPELDEEELKVLSAAGIVPSPKGKEKMRPGHIVFVDTLEEVQHLQSTSPEHDADELAIAPTSTPADLGWNLPESKPRSKKRLKSEPSLQPTPSDENPQELRKRLLKELSARLVRDTYFRYAIREFEMQRQLMGKGARQKLKPPEKMGEDEDDMDEDEMDARAAAKRTRQAMSKVIGMDAYKPRVYKWKLERKR